MIVGHPRHVVRRLLIPPQCCHLRIISGHKIANRDSHRAIAQEFPVGLSYVAEIFSTSPAANL